MIYLIVKYLHVISSTLLFGTGLGTAFYGLLAYRTRDPKVIASVGRSVVLADFIFTTPAVIIQPLSGLALAWLGGVSLLTGWLVTATGLYLFTGLCWLPVVWLQIRLRRLAERSVADQSDLPPEFRTYSRLWFALGWPAFTAVLAIFALMIFKPDL
jgi:uncharacterized membrane protein